MFDDISPYGWAVDGDVSIDVGGVGFANWGTGGLNGGGEMRKDEGES